MADPKTYTQEEYDALVTERDAAKKHNADLFKEVKDAKKKLDNYDGVDPVEFKALKDAAAEAERKKAAAEGDFKSLEQQLVKKYEGEKEVLGNEAKRLRTAMEKHLIDAAAATELAKHSDSPKLLLPHVRGRMRVVEHEGEFHARIIDDQGTVRIGGGQGSTPMTLAELVEEMKQDKEFAPAFRGTGSSGGGASKSAPGGGGGVKTIAAGDEKAFIDNLAEIASGKVVIR